MPLTSCSSTATKQFHYTINVDIFLAPFLLSPFLFFILIIYLFIIQRFCVSTGNVVEETRKTGYMDEITVAAHEQLEFRATVKTSMK